MAESEDPPFVLRFSSEELPEKERAGIFGEAVGRSILSYETETMPEDYFFNDGAATLLPGLAIATAWCSGTRFTRTRSLTKRSDDVVLSVFPKGRIFVEQRGAEFVLGNGEGYFTLADEVATTGHIKGDLVRCIQVQLPRKALISADVDLDLALKRAVPEDNQAMHLLANYAESVQNLLGRPSAELSERIASHICDLAALAMGATGDTADQARRRGLRAARLRGVKADIAANIGAQPLTIEQVAHRQGISTVYVRKLLEGEGVTFSAFVLEKRLQRVRDMIVNRRFALKPISAIAYEVGFNDLSHFNRAFRRRYGVTPSDMRAEALGGR
ncbi:MAG: AraC family transcriptional regulator [Parvibaculum sp.]|jgi:AraC-like DNA-binding protein|uniref:helix-turn-helix transcriptional regulator n=1 Tax=Parvibaculum sp. TaxID=2024848 RepID=UPI002844C4A6|nr:AraC family transcriptional regulator [Parvibaculum sp.]MDR3498072.1 AraC family transcriptional regulator [Parvibaculum sp.]